VVSGVVSVLLYLQVLLSVVVLDAVSVMNNLSGSERSA